MCVAIPKKVLALHTTASGTRAAVETGGGWGRVDTELRDTVGVGDWVLVCGGRDG